MDPHIKQFIQGLDIKANNNIIHELFHILNNKRTESDIQKVLDYFNLDLDNELCLSKLRVGDLILIMIQTNPNQTQVTCLHVDEVSLEYQGETFDISYLADIVGDYDEDSESSDEEIAEMRFHRISNASIYISGNRLPFPYFNHDLYRYDAIKCDQHSMSYSGFKTKVLLEDVNKCASTQRYEIFSDRFYLIKRDGAEMPTPRIKAEITKNFLQAFGTKCPR